MTKILIYSQDMLFLYEKLPATITMKMILSRHVENYFIFFVLVFSVNVFLFGQNSSQDNMLLEHLNEIDQKMIIGRNKEAESILKELEKQSF